tara:strand:- start:652 stop:1038 length:387 start_codon:yes stop_codon:yes gene_type:complete
MTGETVEIYRNLHKKCFSIRKNGKVVDYLYDDQELHLVDVKFRVQPSGRERVRREKKKNVHAYVKGTIAPLGGLQRKTLFTMCFQTASYEPYTMESFETFPDETPIFEAPHVIFKKGKLYVSRHRRLE